MSLLHVSIIVTENSKIVESELVTVNNTFATAEEVSAFRLDIDAWLANIPTPGVKKKEETPKDPATLLAVRLPQIIAPRDPNLFSPYYLDPEGDAAAVEHRPYDWAQLEVAK